MTFSVGYYLVEFFIRSEASYHAFPNKVFFFFLFGTDLMNMCTINYNKHIFK